jgi:HD-GYP domain-containing protein (c-di-GMP phosphodiesterase class II)
MQGGVGIPAEPQPADPLLPGAGASLREAFGVEFDLWVRSTASNEWFPCGADATAQELAEASASLQAILQAAVPTLDAPTVKPQPHGGYLVIIPVPRAEGPEVVATATVECTTEELLEKLSHAWARELQQGEQLADARAELDCYAQQISDDLEEIRYLLGLTEYLELCDVSRSTADLAQTVLPIVRELIEAEAIVLLPLTLEAADSPLGASEDRTKPVWIGSRVVADATCWKLVERFHEAAAEKPVVENHLRERIDFEDGTHLECLLLTRLGTGPACAGWLLALNRTKNAEPQDSEALDPPSEPAASHFGTVEAGMMQAASLMLATHRRNLELIRERESLVVGALRALVHAVEATDPHMCGHSDRVAIIARRVGEELGIDRWELDHLYLAGLLHDVGKIGVGDGIASKARKLTEDEVAQVRRHPNRGCRLLEHLNRLDCVAPGVLHHHERYDGEGYPQGLAEEEIPLAARIIAVADAYDAMTNSRPYRRARSEEEVTAILREGAGTQWDRRVVEALLRTLPELKGLCRASRLHAPEALS